MVGIVTTQYDFILPDYWRWDL